MRIAQVAPPFETVPPSGYGGTERVIHTLTEELVRRGHEVTLFASGDSRTSARLVPTVEQAVWHHQPAFRDLAAFWPIVLGKVLREEWGFPGYVTSDGHGLQMLYQTHHVAANAAEAARKALARPKSRGAMARPDRLRLQCPCIASLGAKLDAGVDCA